MANQNITLPANQWVRLTITCDGTKTGQNTEVAYRLYINGEEVALQNLLNVGDHPLLKDSRWDIR